MKMTKRIMAVLLAVFLLAALAVVPASAAGTGTIEITNTIKDTEYTLYQIFALDEEQSASGKPLYTVNTAWAGFKDYAGVDTYFTVDATGYVIWKTNALAATGTAFAALARAYLEATPAAAASAVSPSKTVAANNDVITFSGLPVGYYLVYAELNGAVQTAGVAPVYSTAPTTIKAKDTVTGLPIIEKLVQENSDSLWGETNDAALGDTVNFKIIVTADNAAQGYVVTDTLPAGFTMNESSVVVTGLDEGTHYTLATSANGFTVTFEQDYLNTLGANDEIEITYNATLNSSATVAGTGNVNTVELEYTGQTEEKTDSTTTYTWQIDVQKYVTGTTTGLAGAGFKLFNDTNDKWAVVDGNGKLTGWVDDEKDGTELTTNADGQISFIGFDSATYVLKETTVPVGYIGSANANIEVSKANADATVYNTPGTELPSTGGVGTTIFYVAGLVLVLAAVTVLVSKKRANA